MMKTIALAASALIASALAAVPASAQVAPGFYTLKTTPSQSVTVRQGAPTLNCQAQLALQVHPSGFTGVITGGSLTDPQALCSFYILNSFSWSVTIGTFSGGVAPFSISGVGFSGAGPCNTGVLNGSLSSSGVLTITSSSGWTGSPPGSCSFTGALTLIP